MICKQKNAVGDQEGADHLQRFLCCRKKYVLL